MRACDQPHTTAFRTKIVLASWLNVCLMACICYAELTFGWVQDARHELPVSVRDTVLNCHILSDKALMDLVSKKKFKENR